MTVKELQVFLKEHLVPKALYKINGRHNNRICIEKVDDGWDVFYSENKEKIGTLHFEDENSACNAMKNEIRKMMEIVYGLTWVTA